MPATLQHLVTVRSQQVEALDHYLQALEVECAKNPLLDRFGRTLDDLRVPLRVVPYEPVHDLDDLRAREHFRPLVVDGEDSEADHAARRLWAFRGTAFNDDQERRATPKRLEEIEAQLEMAVLLGDPGSGKTEWLKYRARRAAREMREQLERCAVPLDTLCMPVYLRLRDVAAALEKDSDVHAMLTATGCVDAHPAVLSAAECAAAAMLQTLLVHHQLPKRLAPWLWQRLTASRQTRVGAPLLLCLDAWDEVRSGQQGLAHVLQGFAKETSACILLTSRILGYDARPLPVDNKAEGPRRELQICPFAWEETETFVVRFFDGDKPRGQQMLGELRDKIAVAGMAQNPLVGTLLCLAFSPNPTQPPLTFPVRRVEVYKRVLEGLLGEWAKRDDKAPRPPKGLIQAKVRLLEELAYHFFPDEELTEEGVHDFLWEGDTAYMAKLPATHPLLTQLETTPQEALCQDGVLVPCGGADSCMFLHLTFQEYLTACALARRLEDGTPTAAGRRRRGESRPRRLPKIWQRLKELFNNRYLYDGSPRRLPKIWQQVDRNVWLPEWHEVLILLAGALREPVPLLELLADAQQDDVFSHRLALAAVCMPELPMAMRMRQAYTVRVDQITTAAFGVWWEHHWHDTNAAVSHLTRALPALGQVNGCVPRELHHRMEKGRIPRRIPDDCDGIPLQEWLVQQLDAEEVAVRRVAARAVERLGSAAATEPILAALARLLQDNDASVQWAAAEAVGRLMAQGIRMFHTPEGTWVARHVKALANS